MIFNLNQMQRRGKKNPSSPIVRSFWRDVGSQATLGWEGKLEEAPE